MKKFLSMTLSLALSAALCLPAFAAGPVSTTSGAAGALNGSGKSENTIPVTISAEATTFDVTVPTAFPTTLDPTTGNTTTANNAIITNNSYGAVVVSKIEVKDNADQHSGTATWHLADFDKDMSQVKVDENLIGLKVQPKSGRTSAVAGTALKTVDGSPAAQTLLASENAEWIIEGKDATDGSNTLTVLYETNASAVSAALVSETVANIVITIAWNTNL